MIEVRLATTPAGGLRRLSVHGRPVVGAHRQLVSILGNRLGEAHAELLARPVIDLGDGRIEWFAPTPGPARRMRELAPAERAEVEAVRRRLEGEIRALAQTMRGEGDSAALVAHMLDLALIGPGGGDAWVVGSRPVLVQWGHAEEGQAVPEPPLPSRPGVAPPPEALPPETPPVAPSDAPPDAPLGPQAATPPVAPSDATAPAVAEEGAAREAEAVVVAAPATPAAGRGWLAWLLPLLLLLLLAWLVWRAMHPPAPVVIEHPAPPAAPAPDPLAAAQAEEAALRAELDRLKQAHDRALALCEPTAPPPESPPSPPVRETAPPPAAVAPPADVKPPPEAPRDKPEALRSPPPKPAAVPPKKAEAKPKPGAGEATGEAAKPVAPKPSPSRDATATPAPTPAPAPAPKSACRTTYPPGDEPEVVVIVDGSGSMREPYAGASSRMALAKDSISSVVNGLPQAVDVALIDFSDCDRVRLDRFFPASERGALIGEVRGLQPDRGTPLARSIERAGNIVSSDVESTIVVVSDGSDTCGRDPCAAARAVKAKRPNVAINVIDVSGGDGTAMAQCIANATGGKVLTPNSPLDMKNKVQQATRLPDTRSCR